MRTKDGHWFNKRPTKENKSASVHCVYLEKGMGFTLCMTKKRENGEVTMTKKMASPCNSPVINHLVMVIIIMMVMVIMMVKKIASSCKSPVINHLVVIMVHLLWQLLNYWVQVRTRDEGVVSPCKACWWSSRNVYHESLNGGWWVLGRIEKLPVHIKFKLFFYVIFTIMMKNVATNNSTLHVRSVTRQIFRVPW